jgi:hypothetical protein
MFRRILSAPFRYILRKIKNPELEMKRRLLVKQYMEDKKRKERKDKQKIPTEIPPFLRPYADKEPLDINDVNLPR